MHYIDYITFLSRTNTEVFAYNKREQILFIHSEKLKKFSTQKNTPFPLTQSVKVHRRALVLFLCLIFPAIAVKNRQENLATLTI